MIATRTATRRPARTRVATEAQAITAPSPAIGWTARRAASLVMTSAVRRYELAREAFDAIDLGLGGQDDPALDFYAEILCGELNDAESALIDALLAPQHEGELSAKGGYHRAAHEDEYFCLGGRIYGAVPDPDQDLEIGEVGFGSPAMVLVVRDDPMTARGRCRAESRPGLDQD